MSNREINGLVSGINTFVKDSVVNGAIFLQCYFFRTSSESLPEIITITGKHVQYRSTLANEIFPNVDSYATESALWDEPIVGIVGGQWDRYREDWTKTTFFKSFEKRFVDGCSWEETEYYKIFKREGNKEKGTVQERCDDLDSLFNSMKKEGYISQTEFIEGKKDQMQYPRERSLEINGTTFPEEPRVGIGRNGEIIRLGGGHHRLSFAKILGVTQIPVIVVVRHKRWQKIRNAFAQADSLKAVPREFQQYVDHPDITNRVGWANE